MTQTDEFMTTRQFADASGLSLRMVQYYLSTGRIPGAFRRGTGRWWIPRSALQSPVVRVVYAAS